MSADLEARLVALLNEKSVRFGEFTLASGKKSDFYVDARQTTLHAEGGWLVGSPSSAWINAFWCAMRPGRQTCPAATSRPPTTATAPLL